jgi:WD40 repeat protein
VVVSTPEVLWHGGGNENGKADPVYSVDFHPDDNVLCTSGIDASVPPKGSVRVCNLLVPPPHYSFSNILFATITDLACKHLRHRRTDLSNRPL